MSSLESNKVYSEDRKSLDVNAMYKQQIQHHASMGVSDINDLPRNEQIVLASIHFLTLSTSSKVEIFTDHFIDEFGVYLAKLASSEITPRKFGMFIKKSLSWGCRKEINSDLEDEMATVVAISVNDDEFIERGRDLIAATRGMR